MDKVDYTLHRYCPNIQRGGTHIDNQSEVRRLMERIDRETEAIERAMHGTAIVASHDSINARYNNLGKTRDELAEHVGDSEATKVVYESYEKNVG